jgi:hydantoinase/carbamoylase family amidase
VKYLRDAGLGVSVDEVGNVFAIYGKSDEQVVFTGSHIDTVNDGGRFDGALGVIAGIESVLSLKDEDCVLKRGVGVCIFTNEEGVRYPGTTGSRFFCKVSTKEDLLKQVDEKGISFANAAKIAKFDQYNFGNPTPNPKKVYAFVELHIEQGRLLETEKVDIGIVSDIVGIWSLSVRIKGVAGHAGTTPMWMRHDALTGFGRMPLILSKMARDVDGLVSTIGYISVWPNSPNVIPGEVRFTVDTRHSSMAVLTRFVNAYKKRVRQECDREGLIVTIKTRVFRPPTKLSRRVGNISKDVSREMDLRVIEMVSGAGHDSIHLAKIAETSMIFVPSVRGISHSPQEYTKKTDFCKGANVLLNTMYRLASE